MSKLLVGIIPGLVLNRPLPLAKHLSRSKLAACCTAYTAHTSRALCFPTTPCSLHGRRGRQVVLLVLHSRQPVGGLCSSSLGRQERYAPQRPVRHFSSRPLFCDYLPETFYLYVSISNYISVLVTVFQFQYSTHS